MSFADNPYKQSGVIAYRKSGKKTEILLVSSRGRKRWVIPKGIVEPGLTPAESAAKEAYEEAGIWGTIATPAVGTFRYDKWGGTCRVKVFLFEIETLLDEWPEDSIRDRVFCSPKAASERVREKELKKLILDNAP